MDAEIVDSNCAFLNSVQPQFYAWESSPSHMALNGERSLLIKTKMFLPLAGVLGASLDSLENRGGCLVTRTQGRERDGS